MTPVEAAGYSDLVMAHTPGLVCAHDPAGVILMVNDGAARMLGYDRAAMVGRNLREFIAEAYRDEYGASLDWVGAGCSVNALLRLVRADGSAILVASQRVLVTAPGAPPAIVVHGIDITERAAADPPAAPLVRGRRAAAPGPDGAAATTPGSPGFNDSADDSAQLHRAYEQVKPGDRHLRNVVEHVREVFFETDASGRWTYLNPAWTLMTGFTVAESIGRPFSDFVWAEDADVSIARFKPLIAREREYSRHEIRYRTKSGRFRWFEAHIQGVIEGDRVIGTSGTLRDVTAQRDLSEQLVRAREVALAASRAKSDFLANMSHEIRTPMNGVIGLTDLLLDTTLTGEQREYAEGVKQSAEALLTLINDILDFSKIEAGKLSINPVAHDLHQVVREAVNVVDVKARNKRLRVALDIADRVPQQVTGDPVRIRQVLINLIANAVKFTHVGGVTVTVSEAPRQSGAPWVQFAVTDTGIGIEPGKTAVIFEKFTQADASTTRRYGGSGLGLAICKQLVELMHGEIGAESELGKGSTFWFRVPLPAAETTSAARQVLEEAPARVDAATAHTRAARVLVVEDSAINLTVATRMLQKLGCEVASAENGAVAVEMVVASAYDVVFMDCQMPVLDGYEATAAIRRLPNRNRTRIVAMTAHAMPADRERCLAAGMDDYLSKPVSAAEVQRVLNDIAPALLVSTTPTVPAAPPRPSPASIVAPQATAGGESPASFDSTQLLARMDGDMDAIADLVELLATDGPMYIRSLDTALAAGDLTSASWVAHTIKGSVGHFGARPSVELAAQVETASRANALPDARGLTRRLDSEMTRLIADLHVWLQATRAQRLSVD